MTVARNSTNPGAARARPRLGWALLLAFAAGIFAFSGVARAQESAEDQKTIIITFGYPASIFVGINAQDAKAATKVWGDRMMQKQGIRYVAEVVVYDDMHALIDALKAGELDMYTVTSYDFLHHAAELDSIPVSSSVTNDLDSMKYVVVTRKDSGFSTLESLKGKSIIIAPNDAGVVPETWLDVELMEKGLPRAESFFASRRIVNKPNRAVLPVFFKQADACLVRKDSFELLAELNPQISIHLAPIAVSPFYMNGILCFSNHYNAEDRERMVANLLEMDKVPEGRQILNLFRVDKVVPFAEGSLDSVEELFHKHAVLSLKQGAKIDRPNTETVRRE